jgi:glycosyltransferase involved in cell wall biosynthesis
VSFTAAILTCPGRENFLISCFRDINNVALERPTHIAVYDGSDDVGFKRTRAILESPDEIVVFVDDDDVLLPERFKRQLMTLTRFGERSCVGNSRFFVTYQGKFYRSKIWHGGDPTPAGTLAMWRLPASEIGFLPGAHSEKEFLISWKKAGHVFWDMKDPNLSVHRRHESNVSPHDWVVGEEVSVVELATHGITPEMCLLP